MTAQTDEGPFELYGITRSPSVLIERVEHDAGGFVVRGDLDHVAIAHPSERHAVVEEDRPRILFADSFPLQAGARQDLQLRVHRNLQGLERRAQESAAPFERELYVAVSKPSVQIHDIVVQW